MYKHGSMSEGLKPLSTRDFLSFSYQLYYPCFSPYTFLFNFRRKLCSELASVWPSTWNPIGRYIHISSSKSACGMASTKSIAFESRLWILAIAKMRRTDSMFTTWEYVSQKLAHNCCILPWAHKRALCFSRSRSGFRFRLKDQIAFIGRALFRRVSRWTIDQWPPFSWLLIIRD